MTEDTPKEAAAWFARLRGPAAAAHRADFDLWRSGRPDRQAAYDQLIRRWDEAAVLQSSTLDFGLAARRGHRRRRADRARWLWAAAPVAVGLLVAVYLWPDRPGWLDTSPMPSAWSHRLATPVGAIRTFALPDGSSIVLDTGSVVRWRFTGSGRRVTLLSGRGRFSVAHDPVRPFVVAAGGGLVVAHGTVFDVSLNAHQRVDVTLLQGVIIVDTATAAGRRRLTRMAASQRLAFGRSLTSPELRPLQPNTDTWPTGMLTFASTPLSDALAEANRYSSTPIRLASPDLAALQVSGAFRAGAPRPLAESLATTFDLRVSTANDGSLVLRKSAAPSAS